MNAARVIWWTVRVLYLSAIERRMRGVAYSAQYERLRLELLDADDRLAAAWKRCDVDTATGSLMVAGALVVAVLLSAGVIRA